MRYAADAGFLPVQGAIPQKRFIAVIGPGYGRREGIDGTRLLLLLNALKRPSELHKRIQDGHGDILYASIAQLPDAIGAGAGGIGFGHAVMEHQNSVTGGQMF